MFSKIATLLFIFQTFFSISLTYYKHFQTVEDPAKIFSIDVTEDTLTLVVGGENGITIFQRDSPEEEFVER